MKVTDTTRSVLRYRRAVRDLKSRGFLQAAEPFWQMYRGGWWNKIITDVEIGPDGKSLWCKIGPMAKEDRP